MFNFVIESDFYVRWKRMSRQPTLVICMWVRGINFKDHHNKYANKSNAKQPKKMTPHWKRIEQLIKIVRFFLDEPNSKYVSSCRMQRIYQASWIVLKIMEKTKQTQLRHWHIEWQRQSFHKQIFFRMCWECERTQAITIHNKLQTKDSIALFGTAHEFICLFYLFCAAQRIPRSWRYLQWINDKLAA